MSRIGPLRHPSAAVLADFFAHRLPEFQEAQIEQHLSGCAGCVRLARRVRGFLKVWDGWDARTHATALQQATLAQGLTKAADAPHLAPLRDRLLKWSGRLAIFRQDVESTLAGAGPALARGVDQGLDRLARWGSTCSLRLEPGEMALTPALSLPTRGAADARDPGPAQERSVLARRELAPGVFLEVNGAPGSAEGITFTLTGLPPEIDPPFITVMPASLAEAAEPVVARAPEDRAEVCGPAPFQPILVPLRCVPGPPGSGTAEFVGTVPGLPVGEIFFALEPLNHSLD